MSTVCQNQSHIVPAVEETWHLIENDFQTIFLGAPTARMVPIARLPLLIRAEILLLIILPQILAKTTKTAAAVIKV